jgi:hypothetical protein
MIYTAPYVMFLMRADPLRGQAEGAWALEIETFLETNISFTEGTGTNVYRVLLKKNLPFQGNNFKLYRSQACFFAPKYMYIS